MVILFTCETYEFVQTKVTSNIEIDPNADELIRVNFNVTLYDVQCDFVEVGRYFLLWLFHIIILVYTPETALLTSLQCHIAHYTYRLMGHIGHKYDRYTKGYNKVYS